MGNTPSVPRPIVNFDVAYAKLSTDEARRCRELWILLLTVGRSEDQLDKTVFVEVFLRGLPEKIALSVFKAFDLEKTDFLSFESFVCCFFAFTKGNLGTKYRCRKSFALLCVEAF
jgi:hypothetical protein